MDAKLIEARALIEDVLQRLDIAGHVILHNKTQKLEVFSHFTPSYSNLITTAKDGGTLFALRSVSADYPDKEAQRRDLEATASMCDGIADALTINAAMMCAVAAEVNRLTGALHGGLVADVGTPQ